MREFDRKLILEDGSEYYGYGFGCQEDRITELVFNTSLVGYQEILSDPSYTYQTVVMAYPLIGNYGMAADDFETERPSIGGLAVREYNDVPSNFRSIATLGEIMERFHIPGISGIDTRKLVRHIRNGGSCLALMTGAHTSLAEGLGRLKGYEAPRDAVAAVSRKKAAAYPAVHLAGDREFHVVAIDCGMKENILRCLTALGCRVTVLPWDTSAEEAAAWNPDGIFISNGPGDPQDAGAVIRLVQELRGRYPIFGICLGHQIISLAYGARTYKLKFGHRGGNHPVKNVKTGKIEITSQNHSFAVDPDSLAGTGLEMTHVNLLDHTVEGVECREDRVFSVQYHPESAPGPQDSRYLFDQFIENMEEVKHGKENGY